VRYVKAEIILPDNLIEEIQKYIQGEYLYIPTKAGTRKKWGENSGNRENLKVRNISIKEKYKSGYTVKRLAEEFFLSVDSIRKIIYSKTE
jgi:DNA-binding NarL/FixJ family response regulator